MRTNKYGVRGLKGVQLPKAFVYFWVPPVSLQKAGIFHYTTLGSDFAAAVAQARTLNSKLDAYRGSSRQFKPKLVNAGPLTVGYLIREFEASPRFAHYAPRTQEDYSNICRNVEIQVVDGQRMFGESTVTDQQFFAISRTAMHQASIQHELVQKLNQIGSASGLDLLTDGGSNMVMQAFNNDKTLRGLLPFFIPFARSRVTKQTADRLEGLSVDTLKPAASDTPMIKATIAIIRIARGLDPVEESLETMSVITDTLRPRRMVQFARLIGSSPWLSNERAISILARLCEDQSKHSYKNELIEVLKSKLDSRSSRFADPAVTTRLALPSLSLFQAKGTSEFR